MILSSYLKDKERWSKLVKIVTKGDITKHIEEIQTATRTYFKNLYSTTLENLKEMDEFLNIYKIPMLNQNQLLL